MGNAMRVIVVGGVAGGPTAWPAGCAPCRDLLVFSSGHFIRVLAERWVGGDPTAAGRKLMLTTASLSAVGYEQTLSRPVIRLWNDDHHIGD